MVCVTVNALCLPGLGSIWAGRRVGWTQAPLALAGFGLTLWWLVTFVTTWVGTHSFPATGGPHLVAGLVGVGLFALAWVWALVTSWSVWRAEHVANPR